MPRRGPFPVRGHFWDTPGQNIAIVRHPGTHNVNISPPPDAWECISRAPCRRRTAESALRAHVVMRRSPGNALRGHVLPCPTARWRTAAAYRQQSHPSAAQGAVCSFPPYPARAHPRDAAVPSCGGGCRRDERAGTLARAAYWGGRGRDIDARRLPGAREGHRRAPSAGCGGSLTCGLPGARGPSAAGSQPAEAWSRLGRGTY